MLTTKELKEGKKLLSRYQSEPVPWIKKTFNADPWEKQEEILNAVAKYPRVAVRSCHGVGKTKTAAWVALWFLHCFRRSKVITTAPTWTQVKNLLWREIRSEHAKAKYKLGSECLTTNLEIDSEWFAIGLSTNESERFSGYHAENILLIVDEASGVSQDIFDAAEGFMTSVNGKMLLIGNPTRLDGEFYQAFKSSFYHKIHISAFDSPNLKAGRIIRPYLVTPEWAEDKKEKWGEDSPLYQVKVKGDFPQSSDDTLIPLAWIEAAEARFLEAQDSNPIEIGVDVARFGSDDSVITIRRGIKSRIHSIIHGQDTMELTGRIIQAFKETEAQRIKVDVIGVGSGVVDRLSELRFPVAAMNGAEAARDPERFINKRAEWYWSLRERYKDGAIAIERDDELEGELASIKYKYNSRGRIQIESKEEIKKRSQKSPDRADSQNYAFGYEEDNINNALCW